MKEGWCVMNWVASLCSGKQQPHKGAFPNNEVEKKKKTFPNRRREPIHPKPQKKAGRLDSQLSESEISRIWNRRLMPKHAAPQALANSLVIQKPEAPLVKPVHSRIVFSGKALRIKWLKQQPYESVENLKRRQVPYFIHHYHMHLLTALIKAKGVTVKTLALNENQNTKHSYLWIKIGRAHV